VNEAHEVLSDPQKRAWYDKVGEQWNQYYQSGKSPEDFDWGGMRYGNPGGGGNSQTYSGNFEDLFGDSGGSFSDFFQEIFGGSRSSGGGSRSRSKTRGTRGQDVQASTEITLEQAFHGTELNLSYEGQTLKLKLKPGIADGQVLKLKGKGISAGNGTQPGDLYLTIQIIPHARFTREGDDLHMTLAVDLYTCILGGKVELHTLEKNIRVTIEPGTEPGKVLRLKGMGMPNYKVPNLRGDLLATVQVKFPKNLNAQEKALFEQLRSLRAA
jgi:curved DNA-binding protein